MLADLRRALRALRRAPGFFATLLAGRWLGASDRAGAEPVAVANDALVREVWPGAGPDAALGQCLRLMTPDSPCRRVVGVVRAARAEGVFEEPPSQYHVPLDQPQRGEVATAVLALAVAAAGLYGVATLLVAERTRELGIRRALGARPGDVVRLVGGPPPAGGAAGRGHAAQNR
jgi:hypothetical protein